METKIIDTGRKSLDHTVLSNYDSKRISIIIKNVKFPRLNMGAEIDDYRNQLLIDNYSTENVRLRRIVKLPDEDFKFFCNNLLCEYSFLKGVGGHEKGLRQVTLVSNDIASQGVYVDGYFGNARYVGLLKY